MQPTDDNDRPALLLGIPALTCLDWTLAIAIIVVLAAVMWPEWHPARE